MTIRLDTDIRNDIVDAIVLALGSSDLKIYTGAQPASANNAASGTLLVTINLSGGMDAAASGSSSLTSAPETGTAVANGTAGYGRLISGDYVIDGSVATSGGDFTINTLSIVSGGDVSLTAFSITMPSGEA
jgi:hypothetical protein